MFIEVFVMGFIYISNSSRDGKVQDAEDSKLDDSMPSTPDSTSTRMAKVGQKLWTSQRNDFQLQWLHISCKDRNAELH